MGKVKTSKGVIQFKQQYIYLGIKVIDKKVAIENLKELATVFHKHGLKIRPAYGTLLGIVRDSDIIDWDEDIDLFILSEEKQTLFEAFYDLIKIGFEILREEHGEHLYSIRKNGEYIDFYIMDSISPEIRTAYDGFALEKHLLDVEPVDFKGVDVYLPIDSDEYLTLQYGDWRTPLQYANYNLPKIKIIIAKFKTFLKHLLPNWLEIQLLKKHHNSIYLLFVKRCKEAGIKLSKEINW